MPLDEAATASKNLKMLEVTGEVQVPCPVCLAAARSKHGNSPYWVCPDCDCWFQAPQPPKRYGDLPLAACPMSPQDKEVNKALAAALFRDWIKGSRKTLDIGCNYPFLAHCFKALGCEAYGMDNIPALDDYGRDLDVPVLTVDFEKVSEDQLGAWTRGGHFSLITLVHVFEHLYEPLAALRKLRKLIADDGALFIRLPDHRVSGFERDLTSKHYTIHPFFHCLSSLLELLVRGQDLFTVCKTYPLQGAGQRDLVLRPLMKKPVVLAGLIVKNEERDLPRCLRSIEAVCDGVVLVDTGSTDATLQVAQPSTALPIYGQTYTGASLKDAAGDWKIWDFSKARNVFVREIEERGADYVLWMDADDELLSAHALRRAFYLDQYVVFGVQMASAGSRWVHHRAWKTRRGIRFEGRCHEYPTYGGHAALVLSDVVVRHNAEPGIGESSSSRNLRILLEEFAEKPSTRAAFYLGNTYREAGLHKEAVDWYEKRISLGRGYHDEWLFAHLYKARSQRLVEDFEGARETLGVALAVTGAWSEFWMELAFCSYDQGHYEEAIRHALEARDKPQPFTELWREPWMYTDQPPRLISWCYEHLKDLDKALAWALRARDKIGEHDQEWEDRIVRLRSLLETQAVSRKQHSMALAVRSKIALCRAGAIGDVIMTLNLVPLLRKKWPEHDIDYYCDSGIGAGLRDLLLAAGIAEICDVNRLQDKIAKYVKVFHLVGYPLREGYPAKPMRMHLLDYFARELELEVLQGSLPALRLPLSQPPQALSRTIPYATLQVKTGWSVYKEWPISRWAEVVKACPEIPIYQIGRADEPRVEGAHHDLMGLPLQPTIQLFANATLHLGLDSYANHLTHYLWDAGGVTRRVPAVILWGSTQVDALGYYHNVNISLKLPCQPCFREDPALSTMSRGPCVNPPSQSYIEPRHACMSGIDVSRVAGAVKQRWSLALIERKLS